MGLLGEFLQHAYKKELPERLWLAREHRRLMLAAVAINGYALGHSSAELRADRAVVLAINGYAALQHASAELRADRAVVLAAVTNNGYVLQHASAELRAVVLAAVTNNGCALQNASDKLCADRDVVLAAVTKNGYALRYASTELQADTRILFEDRRRIQKHQGVGRGFRPHPTTRLL